MAWRGTFWVLEYCESLQNMHWYWTNVLSLRKRGYLEKERRIDPSFLGPSSELLGSCHPKPCLTHTTHSHTIVIEVVAASYRHQLYGILELVPQHLFNQFPHNRLSLLNYLIWFSIFLTGHWLMQEILRPVLPKKEEVTKGKQEVSEKRERWYIYIYVDGIFFSVNKEPT